MTKLNWEKANKQQVVNERGGINHITPKASVKKKKDRKRRSQRFMNIKCKFTNPCNSCGKMMMKGSMVKYYYDEKKATHQACKLSFAVVKPTSA